MITRAERRHRNRRVYDRRAKLFFHLWNNDYAIICGKEDALPQSKFRGNGKYYRPAHNYKDLQKNSKSIQLYKNTGTIWDHGYWNKYERHRLNKQSRINARLDLRNEEDVIVERTNLK